MKKKLLQKIANVVMLVAIVFNFALTVSAATTITTDDSKSGNTDTNSKYVTNKGTLKVTNVAEASDTFSAYKILDTYYNKAKDLISYEFTDSFKAFLQTLTAPEKDLTVEKYQKLTSGDHTTGSTTTTSTLDKLVSKYATYVKTNSVTGTAMTTSAEKEATAEVEAGSYLILPTSTKKVYAVMVGNVSFKVENNSWELESQTIKAKVSDVSITKTVPNTSYNFNEEHKYTIAVTAPTYPTNAINQKFEVTDVLSNGLDYKASSLKVTSDAAGNTPISTDDYTTNISGRTITVNFTNLTTNTIYITYTASLNENAVIGSTGNDNDVTLEYSNDPYKTDASTTKTSKTTVKTYGIQVTKYDAADASKKLEGATFDVFTNENLTPASKVGTITTADETGIGTIKGLKAGKYYLKETAAPNGYVLTDKTYEVTITEDIATGYAKIDISNPTSSVLPFTGGHGPIMYVLYGLIVFAIGFVLKKRNETKVNA